MRGGGSPKVVNRQQEVEQHQGEILQIKKTQIRTVKPVHYRAVNVQQTSVDAIDM